MTDNTILVELCPSPVINVELAQSPTLEVGILGTGPPGPQGPAGRGVPGGGEEGNVLLRTADGAEWGALDYEDLNNKPRIEGVVLVGDKTFDELHMSRITNSELETMLAI